MKINYENSIEKLLETAPEFVEYPNYKSILEEGSANLPYIVFGILRNYYINEFLKKNLKVIEKIAIFLESLAMSDDKKIVNLLAVGFLENLNPEKEYYPALRDTFGHATKRLLDEVMTMP